AGQHDPGAIDVALHQVPAEPVAQLRRSLQVQPIAAPGGAQARTAQRLADHIGAELPILDVDDGQAYAVHRYRVTGLSIGAGHRSADGEARRIGPLATAEQLPQFLDDAGEHGSTLLSNPPHRRPHARACARSDSIARTGSSAPYTAEPATKQSTPASAAASMVSSLIPPSISTRIVSSPESTRRRAMPTLANTSGMNSCPPNPGSTDMISSVSNSGRISRYGSRGVPGLTDSPAFAPAARMSRATPMGLSVASA